MCKKRRKAVANKRPTAEDTVTKLRQIDVLTWNRMRRLDAISQTGVTDQTFQLLAMVGVHKCEWLPFWRRRANTMPWPCVIPMIE
jgi:hypothetical protein